MNTNLHTSSESLPRKPVRHTLTPSPVLDPGSGKPIWVCVEDWCIDKMDRCLNPRQQAALAVLIAAHHELAELVSQTDGADHKRLLFHGHFFSFGRERASGDTIIFEISEGDNRPSKGIASKVGTAAFGSAIAALVRELLHRLSHIFHLKLNEAIEAHTVTAFQLALLATETSAMDAVVDPAPAAAPPDTSRGDAKSADRFVVASGEASGHSSHYDLCVVSVAAAVLGTDPASSREPWQDRADNAERPRADAMTTSLSSTMALACCLAASANGSATTRGSGFLGWQQQISPAWGGMWTPASIIDSRVADANIGTLNNMTDDEKVDDALLHRAMADLRDHVAGVKTLRAFRTPTVPQIEVHAIRRRLGDSADQFSARLGVTRDLVISWECGEAELNPDLCRLLSLLDAFPEEVTRLLAQIRAAGTC